MSGLYDLLNSEEGRFNLGLLAAAAPRATRTSLGERMQDVMSSVNDQQNQAQERQLREMMLKKTKAELDAEQLRLSDATKARQVLMGYGMPTDPQSAPKGLGAGLPADVMAFLPKDMQTPPVAAMPGVTPPRGVIGQGGALPKVDLYNYHMGLADQYRKAGLPDQYQAALANAEKFRPKYSPTPQKMRVNGKDMFVLTSEDGSVKTLDGYDIPPEMIQQDDGRTITWVDKNNVQPGQSVTKKMSLAEAANLGIARDRLKLEQDGTWSVSDATGGLVNSRTGKTKPLLDAMGNLVDMGPKNEDQGRATGWLVQATNAYNNMLKATDPKRGGDPSAAKPGFNDVLAGIPSMGLTSGMANMMRGAPRQQFMQASSSLAEALLRMATGAGVNHDEAVQKVQELTPVFGEADETTKQKMDSIPLYIASLRVRAGRGVSQADRITGAAPAPAFSPKNDPLELFNKD